MKKTTRQSMFLGKIVPVCSYEPPSKKPVPRMSRAWLGLFVLPIALGSILVFSGPGATNNADLGRDTGAITRRLAAVPSVTNSCASAEANLRAAPIFPLIPSSLRQLASTTGCVPALWTRGIIMLLFQRILILIDWFGTIMAVILTVIAGVFYISGYDNKTNVEKGKKILTATYIGLAIMVLASFIVSGTYSLFASNGSTIDNFTNR